MFIAPCFGFGGLERVILSLVANIDRTRFTPSFCALYAPDPAMYRKLSRLGLSCTIIDKGEGINYYLPFRLAGLLRREQIELVNSHDIGATLFAAPAARLAGITKVVHTDHSQILAKKRFPGVYRLILRHLVTHIIPVSQDLSRYLVRTMQIDQAKITTIPNGIDVLPFATVHDVSCLRKELGIPEKNRIVGTIGRLVEQKGTEYLIRGFAQLAHKYPDTTLVIVGKGELRFNLEHLVDDLTLGNKIIFTGIREDIPELMNLFDIFVLPSLWEGQPITIIEAMAAGKPVVATDVGGNRELLMHGEFGLLVPPKGPEALARAMERLFADPHLAEKLGERARAHATVELSSSSMTKRYENVFSSLFPSGECHSVRLSE